LGKVVWGKVAWGKVVWGKDVEANKLAMLTQNTIFALRLSEA
jgi:hypothetical protein